MSLFERLYSNQTGGLQDKFISYWKTLANKLSKNPFVLGFDPLNEPFPSNIYTNPDLFYMPGEFDKATLQPLYKRVFEEAYLPVGGRMWFEPAQFPDFYGIEGGIVFNLGFTEAPGGKENAAMQVLNDHTYCCEVSAEMCASGEPPLDQKEVCRDFHLKRVNTRKDDANRYGTPLFISEFGACLGTPSCI